MPLVAGRNVPVSVTAVPRTKTQTRVRLVINPTSADPNQYTYTNGDITIGQSMATRRMVQKNNPDMFFEFTFPPTQIAYEGMGVEISEIPRPLQRPLIDIRASKNYKAVFEFLVAEQFDGLSISVEEQLRFLEYMANMAQPVYFENFDIFLTSGFWYIAEFSVKTNRVNTNGEIVAAQCSISLLEYQETETKFAKFPKLNYTPTIAKTKKTTKPPIDDQQQFEKDFAQSATDYVRNKNTPAQGTASTVEAGYNTKVYRWKRTQFPDFTNSAIPNGWTKEGKYWYLYTTTEKMPFNLLADERKSDLASTTPTAVIYENLTAAQKLAYNTSIAELKKRGGTIPPPKKVKPLEND